MRKVSISTGTGASRVTVVLGDDSLGHYIRAFLPGWTKQTQAAPRLRAPEMAHFDRANRQTRLVLQVQRAFDSLAEAEAWMQEHMEDVPNSGTLRVETGGVVRWMAKAQIDSCSVAEQAGTHVIMQYQISGGQLTLTEPT